MPPEIDGLGDRLRDARTDAGISQRELARRLDLSPSLISQLEKGISKPSVGTLYAIVTELGVSVDTILRGVANEHHFPPSPVLEGDTAPTDARARAIVLHGRASEALGQSTDSVADAVFAELADLPQAEAELRRRHFAGYQITPDVFEHTADDAIFMHCLPAHRGEEVSHEMMEHPRSKIIDQAENRLHSFKAILLDELA